MKKNRALGAVSTPKPVIEFMLETIQPPENKTWRILEPACADAPFLSACKQKLGTRHTFTGIEYNQDCSYPIPSFAEYTRADYLLWNSPEKFDLIIGNPPYGIIGHKSHYPIHSFRHKKATYKEQFETWYGKYNIYGAFIEKSVRLLNDNGQLVFIVPASWMLLDDFKKLRLFLTRSGSLHVHYVGKVFPNAQVAAVVLRVVKNDKKLLRLYDWHESCRICHDYAGGLITFETEWTAYFKKSYPETLETLFDIFFAARSPEIRAFKYAFQEPGPDRKPLLTGRNLKPGYIDYETNHTGYWIQKDKIGQLRTYYEHPHLVVGHTKGSRIVAAWEKQQFPWREEFHLMTTKTIKEKSLLDFLNSSDLQRYTSTLYRDLIPHITKTQLKALPTPSL